MPSAQIRAEIDLARSNFRWNVAEFERIMHIGVAPDLAARAIRVESAAKQYATGQGGGPNVRTGRLRGSITWRLGEDVQSVYADIGTSVFYAPFLEFGTSKMLARPFLNPALEAAR